MELLVRAYGPDGKAVDVRVDIDPDQTGGRLAVALAEAVGVGDVGAPPRLVVARSGALIDPEQPVGASGLVSGDAVVVNPVHLVGPPPPVPVRGISVDVLAGPDSGRSVVLSRGTYTLGRGRGSDVVFSDPTISRRHLVLEVAPDWTMTITSQVDDEGRVLVNGRELLGPTVVTGDDILSLGATRIAVRDFIRASDEIVDQLGQIEFHRTPYRPERVRERQFPAVGPVPTAPEPRRFQVFAALAPLAAGLAMFAFSRQVQFLALTLISPIAIVANWVEERKSGRRRHASQVQRFRQRVEDRRNEARLALDAERVERFRSAPDLADLARRAQLRTINLWPRGRGASDFLTVRLGLGDVASQVSAPVEPNGDDELRDEAAAALAGHDRLAGVPITVDLTEVGVLGVHGDAGLVDDVAASIALQAACLHSPEDLIVAGALTEARGHADWLKWLPQVRSVTSPLAGRHLTTTRDGVHRLLAELIEVAEHRVADGGDAVDRRWPWLLVFLDADLDPDPTLVSQLLDRCPSAGISVVWLSTSEARVPRQAAAVVDCQPTGGGVLLWRTDPGVDVQPIELGQVHPEVADLVARSLAPVRDASVATATTSIPRTAPLLGVLGVDHPDANWVLARWAAKRPYGLQHPVGLGANGVFELDLVADGPHALIGGTSGAGKSELLQSIVASLITLYPPTRLNFLFVDYKGGASSTVFRDVPHTVGYVTNLNAELALRALTSLRAELNRRMRLLEGQAKDLEEMLARDPSAAPPSLVIVVDEFATLVKEVPDFVAGMVDIAQRGRSLGIHLILATQRPSGSVNDNILANTNLRLSLRMLDGAESAAIIGSPEAADIPAPLRGRGFARLGPRQLVAFQSAYAGAPLTSATGDAPVVVEGFTIEPTDDGRSGVGGGAPAEEARTHLDAVIDAVVAAAGKAQLPAMRAPWQDELASHITLATVAADRRAAGPASTAGRLVPMGVIDDPEAQDQYPAVVDLEEGGGLLVYGSGGSGKTTLLRTIAASAALGAPADEVVVFGLDFASRALRSIEPLPHVAGIGTGDDLEAVTRIIALLAGELDRRRGVLAEAQAETLTAYLAQGRRLARVVLLVDGYPNLAAAFTGGGYANPLDGWLEQLHRIVLDGRQVGIHTVLTADRRVAVPGVLQSAIANRIVLRQADENGYADHGIPPTRAKGLDLAPGRGLWQATQLLQVACVADTGDGPAQAAAIASLAAGSKGTAPADLLSRPLPDEVAASSLPPGPGPLTFSIGVADLTGAPVVVDLGWSNLLVAGPSYSGRSTTLATVASALAGGHELWLVGPNGSALATVTAERSAFGRGDGIAQLLEELGTHVELAGRRPRVLVVDDLDAFDEPALAPYWEKLARADDLRVVAAIEARHLAGYTSNALLVDLRSARRLLVLQPDDPGELFQQIGVRAPLRPGLRLPRGRGVLVVDRVPTVIQVATTEVRA